MIKNWFKTTPLVPPGNGLKTTRRIKKCHCVRRPLSCRGRSGLKTTRRKISGRKLWTNRGIVRVHIRSVITDVAVDIHLLISAKPKLQYYAGAVSQVPHVLAK